MKTEQKTEKEFSGRKKGVRKAERSLSGGAGGRERSLNDLTLFRPHEFCRCKTRGKRCLTGMRLHRQDVFVQRQGTAEYRRWSETTSCFSNRFFPAPIKNTAGKYNFITRNKPPHYAFLISHVNPKLPHFLRQPLYTILVLPRQIVDLMHGAVNLLNACRSFLAGCTYCV